MHVHVPTTCVHVYNYNDNNQVNSIQQSDFFQD